MNFLSFDLPKSREIPPMKIGAEWRFKKNLINRRIEQKFLNKKERKSYE